MLIFDVILIKFYLLLLFLMQIFVEVNNQALGFRI